jgi:hypothetical protein
MSRCDGCLGQTGGGQVSDDGNAKWSPTIVSFLMAALWACPVDLCRASGDPVAGWLGGGGADTAVVAAPTTTPPGGTGAPRSRLGDPRDAL